MDIDFILDIVSDPATPGVVSDVCQIEPQKLKDFTTEILICYFAQFFQTNFATPIKEDKGNLRYCNCMATKISKNLSFL